MTRFFTLAAVACMAALPTFAVAQSEPPLELSIPGDFVNVNPSAFTSVEVVGQTLVLQAHQGFVPIVADYTANAPSQAITASVCGHEIVPFRPAAPSPSGRLMIPMPSADFAATAAAVLRGD